MATTDDYIQQVAAFGSSLVQWLTEVAAVWQADFVLKLSRVQRSYRRDLHRAYRRRYHQRPPLRRASR